MLASSVKEIEVKYFKYKTKCPIQFTPPIKIGKIFCIDLIERMMLQLLQLNMELLSNIKSNTMM